MPDNTRETVRTKLYVVDDDDWDRCADADVPRRRLAGGLRRWSSERLVSRLPEPGAEVPLSGRTDELIHVERRECARVVPRRYARRRTVAGHLDERRPIT